MSESSPSNGSEPQLTTASGTPVADNQNTMTAGPRGPVLMQDWWLIEKMAHFNRERVRLADRESSHCVSWKI